MFAVSQVIDYNTRRPPTKVNYANLRVDRGLLCASIVGYIVGK